VSEGGRGIMQLKLVSSGNVSSSLPVKEGFKMEKPTYVGEVNKRSGIVRYVMF